LLRARHPQRTASPCLKRPKAPKSIRSSSTAARYPILETLGSTRDGAPERGAIEDAHDKAAKIEVAATVKLRKTLPTTVAGIMAVTAYFVEHRDRYPCWIGGETKPKPGSFDYPEPRTFEDSMIRNLAAALMKIKAY
jgi:hypothetical protein